MHEPSVRILRFRAFRSRSVHYRARCSAAAAAAIPALARVHDRLLQEQTIAVWVISVEHMIG
jgi:hypothetical protein